MSGRRLAGAAYREALRLEHEARRAELRELERDVRQNAWADLGIGNRDREAQEVWLEHGEVYAAGGPHSWFKDFIRCQLAYQSRVAPSGHALPIGDVLPVYERDGTLEDAERRLATVEKRDVSSGDPGAASFLGPGYLGEAFNLGARAEGSLAAALPSRPLPRGVKQIGIPRLATAASAAVQNPEGSAASQTDVDADLQAGLVATVAGRQRLSIQALEFPEPDMDLVLAADLGRAIGASIDAQLVSGSNASGQTLGLATVTGIKTVAYTDASPTSQEMLAKAWAGYDAIANGGQGVADPDRYLTVVHPRRLAWLYNNPQAAQTIAPQVPGRLVACAGLRTTLGGGTEDEAFCLLADELPVFAGPIRLLVDLESLSGNMQVQLVASRFVATGFGRAPAAICRLSGTGFVAPVL